MANVTVRDRMIWTNHIRGDAQLVERIEKLKPTETMELVVERRVRGVWERCVGEGHPVAIRPVDSAAKAHWKTLFDERRGDQVDVRAADTAAAQWQDASPAEREAAWEAFKALSRAGWRSESTPGDRDELHER